MADTEKTVKVNEKEEKEVSRVTLEFGWYNIDVDQAWNFLKRFGPYQLSQLIFLTVITVNSSHSVLSGMFAGKSVKFRCASGDTGESFLNNTNEGLLCYKRVNDTSQGVTHEACTEYDYDGGGTTLSYLAEWDLVCDRETLGQLPQIITMVGMLTGASTLPHVGDRYGRRKLAIVTSLGMFVSLLVISFVQHFELLLFFKFLSGSFQQGMIISVFTMMVEVMTLELGSFVSFLATLGWTLSVCIIGVLGYLLQDHDWRTFQLATALSLIPTMTSLCFLDESLRWLLGNSRTKEAEAILRKACRKSNKDYNALMDTLLHNAKDKVELVSPVDGHDDVTNGVGTGQKSSNSHNLKAILFSGSMRKIASIMSYTWMIVSMTYYGLTLLSTSLAGDPYLNYFLTSLVELPSAFLMYFMMQKFGRKKTVMISNLMAGIALLLAVFVAQFAPPFRIFTILLTCLTLVGKFFISISFNTVWIYTPELYPTNLRNVGIGISSSAARLGASFSPLFTILARKALWAPGVLFTAGCFITVFLLSIIPETRWRELPKNIDEIDQWFVKDKKFIQEDTDNTAREETA